MKLLVFSHIPPPHHGQSYMIKLLLDHYGRGARQPGSPIECYHVDARYSDTLEDIGSFRLEKVLLALRYCAQAIWCRFRHDVRAFYFVPSPGKRGALYRDWLVMLICRPFFRHVIQHWQAAGLGDWLATEGTWIERWITRRLLGHASLGIALAIATMRDPLWLTSHRVEVVANGIPDPCPDFDTAILPMRRDRAAQHRSALLGIEREAAKVRVLYLAHCTETKGLFDALTAIAQANATVRGRICFQFTIAGAFVDEAERRRFEARVAEPDLAGCVEYAGFVSGKAKTQLLRDSDFFCFPTHYEAEGQPVNLIEAMAFGLTPIATRWRGIPDSLPADFPALVPPHAPRAVADALVRMLAEDHAAEMRAHFLEHYTEARHLEDLRDALATLEPIAP